MTVSSVIEYEGRGWYDPLIGPEVSAACGTDIVERPRARVRLESTLRLDESWGLDRPLPRDARGAVLERGS